MVLSGKHFVGDCWRKNGACGVRYGHQSTSQACRQMWTLFYGPGVKANFLQLLKTVHRGIPLSFKNINNQRSLIYLENLLDGICKGG